MRISIVPCKVLDPRLYSLTIGSRPRDVWNRNTQVLGIHCEWSRQRSLVELVFCCGSQMICTNWESLDSQKYIFLLYQFNPHQVLYIFLLDAFTFFLGLWTVRMGLGNILGRGSTDTVGAGRKHWFRSSVASCLCHSLAIWTWKVISLFWAPVSSYGRMRIMLHTVSESGRGDKVCKLPL